MGFAIKLLLRHRRLLRHPLSPASLPQNPSRVSPFLLSGIRSPTSLIPALRPFNSSRSISWFSWYPSSDKGGVAESNTVEGGRFESSESPSGFNADAGSQTGAEISSIGLNGSDNGRGAECITQKGGRFESSESQSEFNGVGGSQTGAEISSIELEGSGMEEVVNDSIWNHAVRTLISMLDGYHEFSGLPWWAIISTSTLALRLSLFPVLILQLRKGQEIASLMPKLPPPFPPPGRSFAEQYSLFQQKRKELGCPSYMWNFAFLIVQFPCFLLWMSSVRRMCLDGHPGFDNGGALWFTNLTNFPSGILGCVFPILISGLHYINVQISFRNITSANLKGILGLLTKYYKLYLDILAIPLLFITFHVPQGCLVYWSTNASLTLFQQLALRNSFIRMKLGLRDVKAPVEKPVNSEDLLSEKNAHFDVNVPMDSLSPQMLLDLAHQALPAGNVDKAIELLEVAIEKDPEMVRALVAMGQALFFRKSLVEATKYYENAISKIHNEEDSILVTALFGAGCSHILQGNKLEGKKHLKRIAELKEPEDMMEKAYYHKGLVLLGSTLFEEGQKSEAAKYLRIAATYDPGVLAYVKECEEG
ncbi:hypothetical protein Cni_G20111 [Canna indica]|uniref:ALBINO3-like protein 2, chloroplastic n=1 Tax=Canna indica TaxID=4628 RepID=A0AAQ3KMK0_9LILI|nr:hypothetical protein Cni_G20111 [Canna indica]